MATRTEILQGMLSAAIESGDRARRNLLISVAASIVLFAAMLSNRPAQLANWNIARALMIDKEIESLRASASPDVERIEHLKTTRADYAKRVNDATEINIPAFGVSVDINDLGITGGITCIVIALMLLSSTKAELRNVAMLHAEASRSKSTLYFIDLLAMRQVLIGTSLEQGEFSRAKSLALMIGLYTPLPLSYLLIAAFDASSIGVMPNQRCFLHVMILGEVLVFIMLAALTFRTMQLVIGLDKCWASYRRRQSGAEEA